MQRRILTVLLAIIGWCELHCGSIRAEDAIGMDGVEPLAQSVLMLRLAQAPNNEGCVVPNIICFDSIMVYDIGNSYNYESNNIDNNDLMSRINCPFGCSFKQLYFQPGDGAHVISVSSRSWGWIEVSGIKCIGLSSTRFNDWGTIPTSSLHDYTRTSNPATVLYADGSLARCELFEDTTIGNINLRRHEIAIFHPNGELYAFEGRCRGIVRDDHNVCIVDGVEIFNSAGNMFYADLDAMHVYINKFQCVNGMLMYGGLLLDASGEILQGSAVYPTRINNIMCYKDFMRDVNGNLIYCTLAQQTCISKIEYPKDSLIYFDENGGVKRVYYPDPELITNPADFLPANHPDCE